MDALAVVFQHTFLLAAPEVRHVGGDERELARQNFRRLDQPTRSHSHFVRVVVVGFLRQRPFQQRLEFMD